MACSGSYAVQIQLDMTLHVKNAYGESYLFVGCIDGRLGSTGTAQDFVNYRSIAVDMYNRYSGACMCIRPKPISTHTCVACYSTASNRGQMSQVLIPLPRGERRGEKWFLVFDLDEGCIMGGKSLHDLKPVVLGIDFGRSTWYPFVGLAQVGERERERARVCLGWTAGV